MTEEGMNQRLADLQTHLHDRLKSANAETRAPWSADEITRVVHDVVTSLSGDVTASDLKFYSELQELANYISRAKQEIAAIKPKDITVSHIPNATDELDAVVGATEEATNKIMDVCDTIGAIATNCSQDISEQLIGCTTRIFEACNFQDITGQRITKVVQTLKYIDGKVGALLQALGEEIHSGEGAGGVVITEDSLLNGPQLPQNAIDQDEIDRMLSGM